MKQWLKSIFYTAKHQKPTDDNILRLFLSSFVGIILCMACLAGSTWAWFSATVQTVPQTIEAANYDISAAVTDASGQPVPSGQPLEAGQKYTVTLTAAGTALSGGYCKVEGGTNPLYTVTLLPGKTLTFTLIPETKTAYTFTAVWGEYSGGADITDGCTIGTEQPETGDETPAPPISGQNAAEYVVQSGDTLWEIARGQDTTVEELAAYNNISNPASLQIGQTIKIPAAEDESSPSSPTPPSAIQDETAAPDTSAGSTEGSLDGAGTEE